MCQESAPERRSEPACACARGRWNRVSQSSQDVEGNGFLDQQLDQRQEDLKMLDADLLHLPYGPTDPYQFYRVLNVEMKATLPQIEAAYKKLAILFHPDKHDTDKNAWTAQFQILGTIKRTLSNKEERQKYDRQSRRANLNVERERGRTAESPPRAVQGRAREREPESQPPTARMRRRASNTANQENADPPQSY